MKEGGFRQEDGLELGAWLLSLNKKEIRRRTEVPAELYSFRAQGKYPKDQGIRP